MIDRARLAGHLSVEESARRITHYRYVEERVMRMLGGWIALTPELPAKLLFGRHVWDCAQHADLWGRRLPELRFSAHVSAPSNDGVARFLDLVESREGPGDTLERVGGVYRVVKPQLLALYEAHLGESNAVYEPPTRRILARCLDEERRHVAAGATVYALLGTDAGRRARAVEWEARLRDVLIAAGGLVGTGGSAETPAPSHPAATQDVVAVGNVFDPATVPPDIAQAIDVHCRALVVGDTAALARQVSASVRDELLARSASLSGATESGVVAFAKIGDYRMVKLRFAGPRGLAILQEQWRRLPEGWTVVAAELVRHEPGAG